MVRSRTVREGSVGLFALLGLVLFGGLAIWLRGGGFGQKTYQFTAEFSDVSGLQIGAPVRFRGVTIGKIAAMTPGAKNVDVILEISSAKVIIPHQVRIQTNRYGLIGEASIDITPLGSLPPETQAFNPLSPDCNSQVIICSQDRLQGDPGIQLFENLARLSELYTDPKFFNSITGAAQSASEAAARIAKLSDVLARLSLTVNREIQGVSDTTTALTKTANQSTQLVANLNNLLVENKNSLESTLNTTSELVTNLNGLISENRANLNTTLNSIEQTNQELRKLVVSLETTVEQFNGGLTDSNTGNIVQNLQTLVANAAETSANLRSLSQTLNDPTNMLTIQRTLDSARATFENAQKITSDLDDLTGDPAFRNNLRNLVNGLSNLVSSTEQLEQQIQAAKALEAATQQLKPSIHSPERLKPYNSTVSKKDADTQLSYLELIPQTFSKSWESSHVPFNHPSKRLPNPSNYSLSDD
jgi:phospholipid/cholesterol/gamma-HCH transport system substrate-binding protein